MDGCGAEILKASAEEPFLSFVLQIDPALVRKVAAEIADRPTGGLPPAAEDDQAEPGVVSPLDPELMAVALRFLRSLDSATDRRVLAPRYVEEMVYRVLRREQFARMLRIAARQSSGTPISAALTFARTHYAEPLTVDDLARQVALSPSAFSRLFREVTGRTPYQFLKEYRLGCARELLQRGRPVQRRRGVPARGLRERLALHQGIPRSLRHDTGGVRQRAVSRCRVAWAPPGRRRGVLARNVQRSGRIPVPAGPARPLY